MKLRIDKGLYFTSDIHLGHKEIVQGTYGFCPTREKLRNFPDVPSMNDGVIGNINRRVKKDDTLFILGDIWFGDPAQVNAQVFDRINCRNVYLIPGNHDRKFSSEDLDVTVLDSIVNLQVEVPTGFTSGRAYNTYNMVLCHFPFSSWEGLNRGHWHLHGHTHLLDRDKLGKGRSLDVGLEGNNLEVYSINEIVGLLKTQPINTLEIRDSSVRELVEGGTEEYNRWKKAYFARVKQHELT